MEAYIEARTPDVTLPQRLKDAWKALRPDFDNIYPEHVNRARCQSYADQRRRSGRSNGTIHVELGMLRAALNWARKEEWIDVAPNVWLPAKPEPKERHLTREEADKLLAACATPHMRLFVLLALHTAGRAGAILDLKWDRVDFMRRLIHLRDPERPKTRKGRATVPINDVLLPALQEARKGALTDYVIEWAGGRVLSIKKGFAAAVERAGIAPCTPHTLRHTAATWMAEGGIPMPAIAEYLGHTDSRTTERAYAKFSPEYLRRAADALAGSNRNRENCA